MQPLSPTFSNALALTKGKTCTLHTVLRMKTIADKPPAKDKFGQKVIAKVFGHWIWSVWMATLTVYALFGDDIRLAATSQPSDPIFFTFSSICLGFFLFELVLASYAKADYWLGFYFYLDLLACISMITDIGWIWDAIVGEETGKGGNLAKSSQIARAARASRAGTRAGRIIRIVRVARLIRLVKLYKIAQERRDGQRDDGVQDDPLYLERSLVVFRGTNLPVASAVVPPADAGQRVGIDSVADAEESVSLEKAANGAEVGRGEERMSDLNTCPMFGTCSRRTSLTVEYHKVSTSKVAPAPDSSPSSSVPEPVVPEESKVGQKLSDITTKRIIILILGMMFFLPMFSNTMYVSENSSYEYGLLKVDHMVDHPDFDSAWNSFIEHHSTLFNPLAYVEILSVRKWQSVSPSDLRSEERRLYVVSQDNGSRYYTWAVEDLRPSTRIQAGLNIARTVFICIVLTVTGMLFSKDANELVIGPIENMTGKIKKMIENPLRAAQEAEYDDFVIDEMKKKRKDSKKKEDLMETELLERTIVKIGALLVLGFGEAGAAIIASNMKRGRGDIDPIVEGKKTYCIFGFCDIRDFQDVAEVLQEGVMNFVNEIALIVHSTVYKYSGAANKNIGDAFLLVWKIPEEYENHVRSPEKFVCPYELTQIADMSVLAFMKVLALINTEESILKYRAHKELREHIPNYVVKMGFGLHVGWAIEGAIGSEFKVDASYLSPIVNLASRLEAATRQFGVPILFSGQVQSILSPEVQEMCRQIDCVLVKGSKVPLRLFTLDVYLSDVSIIDTMRIDSNDNNLKQGLKAERERIYYMAMNRQEEVWTYFRTDIQLISMRKAVNPKFLSKFSEGYDAYLDGRWSDARRDLLHSLQVKGDEDGPARTLLTYMSEMGDVCPPTWAGCRELTEK